MTEEWVDGEWIRERLRVSGKTQRELARALEIDASGVSRLLDGRRQLKADEVRIVRAFFDASVPIAADTNTAYGQRSGETGDHRAPRNTPGPRPRSRLAVDIPVYGPLVPERRPFFDLASGPPAEYRACPPQLVGVVGAFGLFVPDDSLVPRMRSGEVVYVHPSKPPITGCDVFVRLRSPVGRVAILQYLSGDDAALRFGPVNADRTRTGSRSNETMNLERGELAQMGRIVLIATE